MIGSVEAFVAALRSTPLLPDEQTDLAISFAGSFQDVQEYAKHLVRQKIISLYQAKKILANRTHELVIGSYVVVDKLGEGGMGKVYKAIQTRMKRLVALKVVKASLLKNEIALKRFQREMKAASSLAHPNIIRVFDADQIGDRYYLAMEYIEGPDLSRLVKENGPLDIGTACSLVRQTALGLQHAHEMGIVHRDIKPSNILVTVGPSGSVGPHSQAKILDMGLARAMAHEDDGVAATELTRAGTVVGTPDYMSPEQAKNSSLVDGRSDLYSLGCTLFYLVTGEVVFPNGNALEKLMSHQMDPPRSSQLIRFDVPTEVDQIIQTLLSKKPSERFQSGAALAKALTPFCGGENTTIPSSVLLAEAVEGDSSATLTASPPHEPFVFRSLDTVKIPPPSSPLQTPKSTGKTKVRPSGLRQEITASGPPHLTNSSTEPQLSPKNPRRRPQKVWLIILLILLATLLVTIFGLVFLFSLLENHPPKENGTKSPSETEVENTSLTPPIKKETPKKELLLPEKIEPFTKYCPDQTRHIIHLDLKKIANTPGPKYLTPHINKLFANLSEIAGIDLSIAIETLTLVITPPKDNIPIKIENENFVWILQGHHFVDEDSRKAFSSLAGVTTEVISPNDPKNGILYTYKPTPNEKLYFALFNNPSVAVLSKDKDLVIETIQKKCGSRVTKFQDESIAEGSNRVLNITNLNITKATQREIVFVLGVKHSWGLIDPREYKLDYLFLTINSENRGFVFDFRAVGPEKSLSKFTNELTNQLKNLARTVNSPDSKILDFIHEVLSRLNLSSVENKINFPRLQHLRCVIPKDKIENFLESFLTQNAPRK